MIRIGVFALMLVAVLMANGACSAQSQDPVPPPLSIPKALFLQRNPAARSHFLSQLPRRPEATSQAAPASSPSFGGTWQTVSQAPASGLTNPLLLTDGTVILLDYLTGAWYKLTPDISGNYVTGTWSQIASLPSGYTPLYFASAVLPDGRVLIMGGEYNGNFSAGPVWTSLGALYDPVANTWATVSPPSGAGWTNTAAAGSCNGGIGDAASSVLPNGTFMLGASCANPSVGALFNATTLSWSSTGAPNSYQDEQGYTLLPTGNVLTIDVWNPPAAQQYAPGTGAWTSVASSPVSLVDPTTCGNYTIGPAVTRPDGTTVAFGGNTGCTASPTDPTAIYTASSNTWIQGPNVPAVCGSNGTTSCNLADAPAAMLPNGNILFAASAGYLSAPTHFFEFTSTNVINQVADDLYYASTSGAYYYSFLVLPNGQVLATDTSAFVEIYTPAGSPNSAWAPTITNITSCVTPGNSYPLFGTQLNGLSQGAASVEGVQGSTNYPLVRIVNNATGNVFYARTSGHSTMSIASGQTGSTTFQVATATEAGASTLYVIANGIPSAGQAITVGSACATAAAHHDYNADGKSDIAWRDTGGNVAVWEMNGMSVLNPSATFVANVSTTWTMIGSGDFNGDGKSDILWRDTSGNVAIWFMNGTSVLNPAATFVGNVPTAWTIVGTGDFNGDGKSDILWRDTSGDVAIWEMNGTSILNPTASGVGNAPTSWTIVGTGDFNGDGNSDILWRDTSGDVAIWEMSGTSVLNPTASGVGNASSSVWTIVGTGDFNGDGKADILWRDSSGNVAIWEMNGTGVLNSTATLVGNVSSVWTIVETGDYNGDGKSDILWRNTTGSVAIWEMNGTQILNGSSTGVGAVSTAWSIQSANSD
jgi:FG-GAP-like repeat